MLLVAREQSRRRDDAGVGRNEDTRYLELGRDLAGEQRAGAARGHEREVARVVAPPDRVQLDRLGHVELLDLQRAKSGFLRRHVEPLGDRVDGLARQVLVELHLATEQTALGPESSKYELRVGRRRLGAAAAIARWPGVGAGRLGPDAEYAPCVDVGERAAARADRVDVDHRRHGVVLADLRVEQVPHAQLAARGDADIGRGSAHVERDHVVVAGLFAGPDSAQQPGDRAAQHQRDWPMRPRLDGGHTA